jgi:MFS family permease
VDPDESHSRTALTPRQLARLADFRRLLLGQSISDFGDGMANLSLFILIHQITGSPLSLAAMALSLSLPHILIGPLAGVWVDRCNRKHIMIVADLCRSVLVLGFVYVQTFQALSWLYAIAFLQACVGTFFQPARAALLAQVIPREGLLAANSLSQIARVTSTALGAAAAGALIGYLHVYWPSFVVDAITFALSAAAVYRVTHVPPDSAGRVAASVGSDLRAGLYAIASNRELIAIALLVTITVLGIGGLSVISVPFLLEELRLPAQWLGSLQFAQPAGMILGGTTIALLARRYSPVRITTVSALLLGGATASLSFIATIWQNLALLFVIGWAAAPFYASVTTQIQTAVPAGVLGRVSATISALMNAAGIAAIAGTGFIAEMLGVRQVYLIAGLLVISAAAASRLMLGRPSLTAHAIVDRAEPR